MEREKQPFSVLAVRATSATRSRIRSETALSLRRTWQTDRLDLKKAFRPHSLGLPPVAQHPVPH